MSDSFSPEAELAALSDALSCLWAEACRRLYPLYHADRVSAGEAMAATWDQVDVEPGFWVKPGAQTKQRKIHKAPIGPGSYRS